MKCFINTIKINFYSSVLFLCRIVKPNNYFVFNNRSDSDEKTIFDFA